MRTTLICTVGTSLFASNLSKLSEGCGFGPENWESLKLAYDAGDWKNLVDQLLKVDPNSRVCGAEINTIEQTKTKKWLQIERLYFLVSDTEPGENTGKVLKRYYENRKDLSLKEVDYRIVADLQDKNPKKFKISGLRNLVREIGSIIERFGKENVAIDATGGYKAQIAIAVLIGQALDIPVYYKHELFSEIIEFPPLPVSLDFDLLGRYSDVLNDFEKGKTLTLKQMGHFDNKLRIFLDEITIEGEALFELNAIGLIYITAFRLRHPKAVNLIALEDQDRKLPTFRPDHYPTGFESFIQKVFLENRWIKTCYSMSYHGQAAIKGIGFFVKPKDENNFELIGTYEDHNNFGCRFGIILSDMDKDSLNWAADQLNQKYRDY